MSSTRRRDSSPPLKTEDLIRAGSALTQGFLALPRRPRWGIVAVLVVCAVVGLAMYFHPAPQPTPEEETTATVADSQGYLFCFWNAENFFDDQEDRRPTQPDKDYDAWFAADGAKVFKQKLKNLTEVLLK